MGKDLVDIYTFGHFISGVLVQILVSASTNLSLTSNFVITNFFHILLEVLETDVNKNGKTVETFKNHVSDIVVFVIGWLIAYYNKMKVPEKYVGMLWFVLLMFTIRDLFAENFI